MAPWSDEAKKGESGLPDDFILTITSSRYTFPWADTEGGSSAPDTDNDMSSVCALVFKGEQNENGDLSDGELRLTCGDFEPGDKEGTFALHSTQDENKHFGRNSKLFGFIKSALEAGVPLEDRQDPSRAQYEEKDALVWEGLILHIVIEEEEGVFKRGPNKGKPFTSRKPIVKEFLGTVGAPKAASGTSAGDAPAAETEADQKAAVRAPAPTASSNGGSGVSETAAKTLLKTAGNYLDWVDKYVAAGGDPNDEFATQDWYQKAKSGA